MPASFPNSGGEPSQSQREEAAAHTAYPVDPESLCEPDGRKRRVEHSAAEIDASYRTQSYLLTWGGGARQLSPGRAGEGPAATLHLLTAWNAKGRRYTYRQNANAQRRLRDLLAERVVTSAVAVPPNRRWFEEVLLTRDLTREQAVDLGVKFGQPAIVEWEAGHLSVLSTSERSVVRDASFAAGLDEAPRGCPIRDDDNPAARCLARGGPWISASIHAHALWRNHRALGIRLLGCAPCQDGRLPAWGPGGSSIDIHGPCLGTRYGGASWR